MLPLYERYMFRPVLRQSSGISIQKRYKERCNKYAKSHLFAVAVFILLKYKSIIIRLKKCSLFCDKHNGLASINITPNLFYTLRTNNIYIYFFFICIICRRNCDSNKCDKHIFCIHGWYKWILV
jgi:hypothetical protein